MKLVVTADTHFPFSIAGSDTAPAIPEGDVLIHCGDLMYSGLPDEWYLRLGVLAAMPHKTKLLLPGNHDFHIQNYNGIARAELRRQANVTLIDDHKPFLELDDIRIFGIPFVTGLPGWAYNMLEINLERWLDAAWPDAQGPDIVISHAPMRNVLDALHPEQAARKKRKHVGSRAMRAWFDALETKPKLWFHGHIHEAYGEEVVDGCHFYNVAMCDRDYKQVNSPVVIEI